MKKEKIFMEINDLFSLVEVKKNTGGNISKGDMQDFYERYQNEFNKIKASLEVNEEKELIIENAEKLDYKKEYINGVKLKFVIFLSNFLFFSGSLLGFLSLLLTCCLPFFIYFNHNQSSFTNELMFFYFPTILTLVILLDLVKNKKKFNHIDENILDNVLYFVEKIVGFLFNGSEELKYYNSSANAVIYKENKTENELYNKILLEEIEKQNFNMNISITDIGDGFKNRIILNAKKKYEEYLKKEKDVKVIKKMFGK